MTSTNFFWTPELAYIIGLLTTDGNLSKDKRHIIMRSSDKDLLEVFKKIPQSKSPQVKLLTIQSTSGKLWSYG